MHKQFADLMEEPVADCIQCGPSPPRGPEYLLCKVLISCAHYER